MASSEPTSTPAAPFLEIIKVIVPTTNAFTDIESTDTKTVAEALARSKKG